MGGLNKISSGGGSSPVEEGRGNMKFANAPAQHLSNYEVLHHFLALQKENEKLQGALEANEIRQQHDLRALYPVSTDEERPLNTERPPEGDAGLEYQAERRGVSEDLIWVQDELIKYLAAHYNPPARQTAEGIAQLADQLQDHGLTKAEVLQIINLCPSEMAELYPIVEEPDTRFHPDAHGALQAILDLIASTLLPAPPAELEKYALPEKIEFSRIPDPADHGGLTNGDGAHGGIDEEEYIHEATWGADKEDAVDDEPNGDME